MFSGFKSGKKLTPKASRGNDGKSASREDVGPRSPDLQRSHDAPAPASPDSSVKYALKSKMTIFGGGGSHLKIHYVKGSSRGEVKIKTKKSDTIGSVIEKAVIKLSESHPSLFDGSGMADIEDFQLYTAEGSRLIEEKTVDECHLSEESALKLLKKDSTGESVPMAPSPLHPSNAITEQPLGDNVDQVKQLLGALAAKAPHNTTVFEETAPGSLPADMAAASPVQLANALMSALLRLDNTHEIIPANTAKLLVAAKENPLPSACARAVVLGLPNENISTLAKLCAMITSAEGVSHDKVAKVWGPALLRHERPEDSIAAFWLISKNFTKVFTSLRPQIIQSIAKCDYANPVSTAVGELPLTAGDIVFVLHGPPGEFFWLGFSNGNAGKFSPTTVTVVSHPEGYDPSGAAGAYRHVIGDRNTATNPASSQYASVASLPMVSSALGPTAGSSTPTSRPTTPQQSAQPTSPHHTSMVASPRPASPMLTQSVGTPTQASNSQAFTFPPPPDASRVNASASTAHATIPAPILNTAPADQCPGPIQSGSQALDSRDMARLNISDGAAGVPDQSFTPTPANTGTTNPFEDPAFITPQAPAAPSSNPFDNMVDNTSAPASIPSATTAAEPADDLMAFDESATILNTTSTPVASVTTATETPARSLLDQSLDDPAMLLSGNRPASVVQPSLATVPDMSDHPHVESSISPAAVTADPVPPTATDNISTLLSSGHSNRLESLREEYAREAELLTNVSAEMEKLRKRHEELQAYAYSIDKENEILRESIRAKGALPVV